MSNPTELPDLDHLEALALAATPGEWNAQRHGCVVGGPMRKYVNGSAQAQLAAFNVTFHDQAPDDEPERQQANAEFCAAANPAAVLALIALARRSQPEAESGSAVWELLNELYQLNPTPEARALIKKVDRKFELAAAGLGKPEGEAPQAVYQMRNRAKGGPWQETDADGVTCLKRMPHWAEFYEFRTLYTAPAAQHAESGAPAAIPSWVDALPAERAYADPRTKREEAMCAEIEAWRNLAAQSQGAQPDAWAVVVGENMANTVHLTVDAEEAQGEYEASVAGGFESIYNLVPLYRRAQQAAAPGAEPVEPPRMTTDESREYLVKFMERHFTDKTYHRYIRGERDSVNLATDFAWQMARALRMLEAAPSAPGTPEAPASLDLSRITSVVLQDRGSKSVIVRFGQSLASATKFLDQFGTLVLSQRAAQLDGGQGEEGTAK